MGIARWLQDYLIKIAKNRGVRGFVARLLQENQAAFHLLHEHRYSVTSRVEEGGVYNLSFKFEDAES
jgi:hypothetical protein